MFLPFPPHPDVTNAEQMIAAVAEAEASSFGTVDILITCAGMPSYTLKCTNRHIKSFWGNTL